jgi:hypothetical protein
MNQRLLLIIKEEIENWFNDDDQSNLNAYSDKFMSTNAPPTAVASAQQAQQPKLDGELVGYVTKEWTRQLQIPIPIFKNPKSLTGAEAGARGVLMANGDFYLTPKANAMHDNILATLGEKGIIPIAKAYEYYKNLPEEFVAVQRIGNMNVFGQSGAYFQFPEYYQEIFKIGEQKQPYRFRAIPSDDNVNEIESPLDPNYQISSFPQGYDAGLLYEIARKIGYKL